MKSDTIERKFVEVFAVSDWEVETDTGWESISASNKTVEYSIWELETASGKKIECADTHILFDGDMNEVFAKDCLHTYVMTKDGPELVISVIDTRIYEHMYDLTVDSENHRYYTGNFLSHNTQVVAAYILWYTLFNDVKNVAILANKGATAREILSRYKLMYEFVPMYMQQGVKTWNKGSIELENNSAVFTGATNAAGIRSKSVNFLYMDEVAIIPNTVFDEFYASSWPTLSSGESTKIVMTSTPLGYNHFWSFWSKAETGENGFTPIKVTWQEHPKRDQKWADAQMSSLGPMKYNQEVDCAFLGSSDTLIDAGIISRLFGKPPIFQKDGLDIYEKPIKGNKELKTKDHAYVMVVDTGKGLGGDYSAFSLIDISEVPYKLVGKYRNNKIAPMLFPTVIHKVATDYNMAYVLFEINASEQVPHIMYYELEYENILFVSRGKKGQEVSAGFANTTLHMGVNTDKKTKRIGCNNIKSIIEEGKIHIFDTDVIAEMSTFIQIKDSYAADDGYHDDLMMTLVLFGWLTTQAYFRDLGDIDLRKAMYQSRMEAIEEEQLPVGWFSDGTEPAEVEVFNF